MKNWTVETYVTRNVSLAMEFRIDTPLGVAMESLTEAANEAGSSVPIKSATIETLSIVGRYRLTAVLS